MLETVEAVADGSMPSVDTGVAAYAWRGALNEIVPERLERELPALADAAPTLSALSLRSGGADGRGDARAVRHPARALIHLSTVIHPWETAASGAAPRDRHGREPRQIDARETEVSDRPMNARARTIRRRASA